MTRNSKFSGFTCPLIQEVGFTSAIQHRPTDDLEGAPLSSSMDLENVTLTDKSTITEATGQLKLISTIKKGRTLKLLPRSQALANLCDGYWEEFDARRNQIPTELVNICHTQQIRNQTTPEGEDKERKTIVRWGNTTFVVHMYF